MGTNPAAQTAYGPMLLAAVEAHEPPGRRLIDDDLASAVLPGRYRTLVWLTRFGWVRRALIAASDRSGPGLWASICCRKRYIDDKVSDPAAETDAVVILGSGLDTRPYRIARYGDLPVFELDLPINIDRKRAAVERAFGAVPPSVRLCGIDFEHGDIVLTLRQHGFRDTGRTLFIWEGVSQYLSPAAVQGTLMQLRTTAPGNRLVFTYIRQDFLDGANLYGAAGVYRRFRGQEPVWKSGFVPEALAETLHGLGWRVLEQVGPGYYRDTYIRPSGRTIGASPIEWAALAVRTD